MGLGKSWVMVGIAEYFKRVVVLQPCLELVKQNHSKLDGLGFDTTMVDSVHGKKNLGAEFIYTTPQSLVKNLDKIEEPDLLIIDECFTGDTLIATPDGYKKIKDIKPGDKVYNATGIGTVLATTAKHTYKTKTLELSNGQKIQGTYTHPIFTEHGWSELKKVGRRSTLFGIQDMPNMWKDVSPTIGLLDKRKSIHQKSLLQSILCEYQKHAESSVEQNKKEIYDWWKRNKNAIASALSIPTSKRRVGNRICNQNRTQSIRWKWISNLLQGRFSRPNKEDCNRSRWRIAQQQNTTGTRFKENQTIGTVRVEGVSYQEQTSPITVYNLHVSGHPSYFAGGVLVHNCNVFYEGSMFNKIFGAWKHCKVAGFTATPYYYKRKTVYKNGWMCNQTTIVSIEEQYGPAVINIDREEGKRLGYSPDIKMRKVGIVPLTSDHLLNPVVYNKIIDEHLHGVSDLCKTLHNGIIYCDSISHAELLSRTFNIPCIFGNTPKKRRVELIEKFNSGRIPFLLTVKCLIRGYDRQDLENIIILTNLNNSCEAEQIIGRLCRGTVSKICYYNRRINTKKPVAGATEIVKIKKL